MEIARLSILENNAAMDPEWLKAELQRRGLRQVDLARELGLTESQMSKVMKGGRKLSGDEAIRALRFLGYPTPSFSPTETLPEQIARLASEADEEQRRALVAFLETLKKR